MIDFKYKVYLDMDGVITDWEKQFERLSGLPVDTYEAEHGNKKTEEFVYQNGVNYYSSMPWMKDGQLLANFLKNLDTEILSHAGNDLSKKGKLIWLKSHNLNFKPNLVDKRTDKSKFANSESILIDDRKDNVEEFIRSGGKAILHTDAITTINTLKEMLGIKQKHRLYNSILNPELFDDNDHIKSNIVDKLINIANTFYKDTELNVAIQDILLVGSSIGYNWTPTSDIDLHILIDFNELDENEELVKDYVDGLKNKWNESHHIYIGNHPVELYIQDIEEQNKSQAVYSLTKNEWIKKPSYERVNIDSECIKKKYYEFIKYINTAVEEQSMDKLKRILKRLYELRQSGLDAAGEYSTENLVFKLLRSTGYINKIRDNIKSIIDKQLSL